MKNGIQILSRAIEEKANENEWLTDRDIQDFAFPNHEADLVAINLEEPSEPTTLF